MHLPKGNQIAAARALLGWDQKEVASRVGLTIAAISKIEKGENKGKLETLEKIEKIFHDVGIEFMENDGVRKRSGDVIVYRGHEGFTQFRELVLKRARRGPLEVSVSNVDERNFSKWGGEEMNNNYRKELVKLGTAHFRIIIKEGDTKLTATQFAEYRSVPEQEFGEVPFYIFDDNLVMIPFEENEMNLFIIKNALLAKYYQKQFEISWAKAKKVGA